MADDPNTPSLDALETAGSWIAAGRDVALATVLRTWRSSPRPAGSQLVVDGAGHFAGSVSGGCVESAVIQAALDCLEGAAPQTLTYGVADDDAWAVGLPCGGEVEIFVARGTPAATVEVLEARRQRRRVGLVTDLATGQAKRFELPPTSHELPADLQRLLEAHPFADAHAVVESQGERQLVQLLGPPLRLVIVGAVHVGQLLTQMARIAGIPVVVVDPRGAFATAERFPDATLIDTWPDRALNELPLDRRTAVVTLSHDAKIDEPALATALSSDCFYIGALGGRKNQAKRRQRLADAGFTSAQLERIHGPVGLDIGAEGAAEIAVSILAQIVERWHRGDEAGR